MSSSRRSGEVDEAHERLLQERLQILLDRLRWSYAALWTLNPQTRVLEWKRGQYLQQVDARAGTTSAASRPKVWYAQQFYTTYRACSFPPGTGYVGMANLEGRHFWLSGDSVCQNAGSLEQSQFLSYAEIKTVMCIPWQDSVLELGTTNFVGENVQLMDQIQQVLAHDLLSAPLQAEDASGFAGHDTTNSEPGAPLQLHHAHSTVAEPPTGSVSTQSLQLPDAAALNQPGSFQSAFDNLSDQVWRSDVLLQEQDSLPDLGAAWRAIGVRDNQSHNIAQQSTSHGLMKSQAGQYGSACTNSFGTSTTSAATASSSSVSSHGDQYSNSSSARPANSASPELLHRQLMHALSPPISRSTAPDRASSTVRLPQGLHLQAEEAYNNKQHATGSRNQGLRRTTSCNDQYEIQKALSLLEAQEMQDQWRQQGLNTVSELNPSTDQSYVSFHTWQHGDDPTLQSSRLKNDSSSQSVDLMRSSNMDFNLRKQVSKIPGPLQRRHTLSAMEVLKEVETYQQVAALDQATSDMISYEQDYFQIQADQPTRPAHVQMNARNFKGRPRLTSSGKSAAHDEAAVNHMLAERRRRVKQKENFATLRRLVPIISKADKASTLVDAIVYLKDLQNTIEEMEANKKDMDKRCEDLASKCTKLEEQNKELVAILSKDKPNHGMGHLSDLRLQCMKSI